LLGTSPVRDLLAGQNYNSQAPANSPPHACRGGRQTGKASHLDLARNLGATRGFPGAVDFRWDGSSAQLHLDWQNYNQGVTACYWAVPPASPTARPRRPPSSRTSMLVIGQPGATVPGPRFHPLPQQRPITTNHKLQSGTLPAQGFGCSISWRQTGVDVPQTHVALQNYHVQNYYLPSCQVLPGILLKGQDIKMGDVLPFEDGST